MSYHILFFFYLKHAYIYVWNIISANRRWAARIQEVQFSTTQLHKSGPISLMAFDMLTFKASIDCSLFA